MPASPSGHACLPACLPHTPAQAHTRAPAPALHDAQSCLPVAALAGRQQYGADGLDLQRGDHVPRAVAAERAQVWLAWQGGMGWMGRLAGRLAGMGRLVGIEMERVRGRLEGAAQATVRRHALGMVVQDKWRPAGDTVDWPLVASKAACRHG